MDQDEFIDVDQVSLNIKQDIENADFQQRVLPSAVSEELIDAESQTFRSVAAVQNTQPTFPVTGTHNALSPLGLKSGCEVEETSQGVVPPALPPHFPLEHTRIIYQGSVNEVKKSVESASSSFSCTLSFDLTKHKWTLSAGNGDNDLKVVVRIFSQPDTSYLVEVQRRQGDAGSFINVYHHIKRILESEVENVENQPMSRSHKRACVFEAATDLRRLPTNLPPIDPQVGAAAVAAVQEMAKSPMVDVAFEGARILKALSSQVTAGETMDICYCHVLEHSVRLCWSDAGLCCVHFELFPQPWKNDGPTSYKAHKFKHIGFSMWFI